jgi:hypothetical protein
LFLFRVLSWKEAGLTVCVGPLSRHVDVKRLSIVLGVLLSALVLSSCLCFLVGYHRNSVRRAFRLPRQLSASLKLPLHYERHTDEQKA